jgi:hypothetical protein
MSLPIYKPAYPRVENVGGHLMMSSSFLTGFDILIIQYYGERRQELDRNNKVEFLKFLNSIAQEYEVGIEFLLRFSLGESFPLSVDARSATKACKAIKRYEHQIENLITLNSEKIANLEKEQIGKLIEYRAGKKIEVTDEHTEYIKKLFSVKATKSIENYPTLGSLRLIEITDIEEKRTSTAKKVSLLLLKQLEAFAHMTENTSISLDVCYKLLVDPISREWIEAETWEDVCEINKRFVNYIESIEFSHNASDSCLESTIANYSELDVFRQHRNLSSIPCLLQQQARSDAIRQLYKREQKVSQLPTSIKKEEEQSLEEILYRRIQEIKTSLSHEPLQLSYLLRELLKYNALQLSHTYTMHNYQTMLLSEYELLIESAKQYLNLQSIATAKLDANFKSANGVKNVSVADSLPFEAKEHTRSGIKDVVLSLDGYLDDTLFLYLVSYYKLL